MMRPRSRRSGLNCSISCVSWASARSSITGLTRRLTSRRCCGGILHLTRRFQAPGTRLCSTCLGAIRTNVYFPAYSNGLKDIASYLGVNWTGKVKSGIDCIAARMRWEELRDPAIKEEILDYNRQDCLAVQRVAGFLLSLGSPDGTATSQVQLASEDRVESHGQIRHD